MNNSKCKDNLMQQKSNDLEIKKLIFMENLKKDDLLSIEEGIFFKEIQIKNNYSLRKFSTETNKNKNYIANRLALTKFSDFSIKYIISNRINNISMLKKILKFNKTLHFKLLKKLVHGQLTKEFMEELRSAHLK